MRISACMIMKNEAENLARWLRWAQSAADEIIVVDTGSTDDSVAMVEAAGIRVLPFVWCDDFAAAKNCALQEATGDWVAFLDADEYFSDADAVRLRDVLAACAPTVDIVSTRSVNVDAGAQFRVLDVGVQSRLFRRQAGLRYVGTVHETLQKADGTAPCVQFTEGLSIFHTGYGEAQIKRKARRNLDLLLRKEKRGETDVADPFYFSGCYYDLGEYENAARYARMGVARGVAVAGAATCLYSMWLKSLIHLHAPLDAIDAVLKEAEAAYPDEPEFSYLRAVALYAEKAYDLVLSAFAACFARLEKVASLPAAARTARIEERGSQTERWLHKAFLLYGNVLFLKGDRDGALVAWVEGLRLAPYDEALFDHVARVLRAVPAVEQISFLQEIYDVGRDAVFLTQALARAGCGKAALYYHQKAGGTVLSRTAQLLFAERPMTLAKELIEEVSCLTAAGAWCMERADALSAEERAALQAVL